MTDSAAPIENHPHCHDCGYDLTGLAADRCPECGVRVEWHRVQFGGPPTIAFERCRGAHLAPGFVQTWLTVLFTPWIFAAQAQRRINPRYAAAFGGTCFLSTLASLLYGADPAVIAAWWCTAAIYVVLQSLLAAGAEALLGRPFRAGVGWWLAVSGYTSAIVATEFVHGPPPVLLGDLWKLLSAFGRGMLSSESVHWIQLVLWAAGMACIFVCRRGGGPIRWLAWPPALVVVLVLYSASVQWIGVPLYELFD
jgi:hypothetical protein